MELIRPRDARELLKVSRHKLEEYVASGLLVKYKIKGLKHARFDKSQILALINSSEKGGKKSV